MSIYHALHAAMQRQKDIGMHVIGMGGTKTDRQWGQEAREVEMTSLGSAKGAGWSPDTWFAVQVAE